MQYHRVPPGFLQGVRIVPHNFDDPENKAHGDYVDMEMKHDLFNEVYTKVKLAETPTLRKGQYFRLHHITPCQGTPSFLEKWFTNRLVAQEDKLIECHDLQVDFNGEQTHVYRTKIYQSQEDRFYTMVFPEGWKRSAILYMLYGFQ